MRAILKFAFPLIFTIIACKAQDLTKSGTDVQTLLNKVIEDFKSNGLSVSDTLAFKANTVTAETVSQLIDQKYLSLIQNFDIRATDDLIDFNKLFSEEDKLSMKAQLDANEGISLSDILKKNSVSGVSGDISISMPLFNLNRSYAILYVESVRSGELKVYKRNHSNWVYFAQGSIWIE